MAGKKKSLLELPVHEAVERLARAQLDAAERALPRLADPDDHKALHAFRVAIRRLRSLLRVYRPWLGKAAGRKVRRRLRDITQATNAWRDMDVQLAWFSEIAAGLERDERAGYRWFVRRLQRRRREASRSARSQVSQEFAAVVRLLRRRLADEDAPQDGPFRAALLEVMEPAVADLLQGLDAIQGADDDEGIHRARSLAKRLRYLVEPLRHQLDEARDATRPLKRLQVLLGELRDVQVLEEEIAAALEEASTEQARRLHRLALGGADKKTLSRSRRRDEAPGLVAVAAQARGRRDALYHEFRRERQADPDVLRHGLAALAGTLQAGAAGAAGAAG